MRKNSKRTKQCNHWSPVGYGGSQQCVKKAGHKGKHKAPMGFGIGIEWESDWKRVQVD